MQYAYLGFLEKLQDIFRTIFETVFQPILLDILEVFVNFFVNVIWTLLSELLLTLFAALCSLLDLLEKIFDVFSGVKSVTASWITNSWADSITQEASPSLLEALFRTEGINLVFRYITLMAMGICLLFTIYKTAKSISDMTLEDKNPISKVLTDTMKAMVTFMVIPFLCIFLLQLSSVITVQANAAFRSQQGGSGSLGTIVFLSASMDADKKTMLEKDLITGEIKQNPDTTETLLDSSRETASQNGSMKITAAVDTTETTSPETKTNEETQVTAVHPRYPSYFDLVRGNYMDGTKSYQDLSQVKKDFHMANFNYLSGFVTAILLVLIMAGAVLGFVRRLFELLLLYLVSPFFVSTIPLDDGAVFSRWRDLFVAKFFSGFGTIFAMKYYLMLVPFLASSNLQLYNTALPNGTTINNIFQLFFIIGGAWSVYNSQTLILQLLAPEAAMAEQQASALITGMLMGGIPGAFRGSGGGGGGGNNSSSMRSKLSMIRQAKQFLAKNEHGKDEKESETSSDKASSDGGGSGGGGASAN